MKLRTSHTAFATLTILAGCSLGPQLQTRMPQVRDVPVIANLTPQAAYANGRTYLATKQYGLAIELFKSAKRDPALEVDSLNGLAIAYDGIGRGDLAERYFQEALAVRTDDTRTRRNLANFYASSGQEKKREALLSDKLPMAVAQRDEGGEDTGHPDVDGAAAVRPASLQAAGVPAMATIKALSPLGSVFQPLLASFVRSAAESEPPPTSDQPGTVVCLTDSSSPDSGIADGPMTMYRLSIGEVFITARPRDAICDAQVEGAPQAAPDRISNSEYLGMVAAFLDRVNRSQMLAERSGFQHGST